MKKFGWSEPKTISQFALSNEWKFNFLSISCQNLLSIHSRINQFYYEKKPFHTDLIFFRIIRL